MRGVIVLTLMEVMNVHVEWDTLVMVLKEIVQVLTNLVSSYWSLFVFLEGLKVAQKYVMRMNIVEYRVAVLTI